MAINPWRDDRLPDRFPTIVQDAIVIALFAVAATLFLQEQFWRRRRSARSCSASRCRTRSAICFPGLAIQIEKPFRVGHWVKIGGQDGLVSEMTWRATKIRTKAGNFVIVPNSVLAKETITNYSEPTQDTRARGRGRRQLRHAAERRQGGDRRRMRDEPLIARDAGPKS